MIPAWLAFFDACLALVLFIVGPIVSHFGVVAPFLGFQMFLFGFLLSILAVLLGAIALIFSRGPRGQAVRPRAAFGVVVGLIIVAIVGIRIMRSSKYPPINDITTDFENPPEFVNATLIVANRGRDMKYDKAKYAERQSQGYGKLDPAAANGDADATFAEVEAVAKQMPTWTITVDDPKTRTVEGFDTSWLFHFQDDFVIQVRSADGNKSLVEMRSKSRDGVGDFGVNFTRIVGFLGKVQAATGSAQS